MSMCTEDDSLLDYNRFAEENSWENRFFGDGEWSTRHRRSRAATTLPIDGAGSGMMEFM